MENIKTYQAVVIGAGPAGSRAAYALASNGIETLIIERKPKPGTPIRCGEGIGEKGLLASGLKLNPNWIKATVNKASFFAPSGKCIKVDNISKGYILDRTVFDYDIFMKAISASATAELGTTVLKVSRNNKIWDIKAKTLEGKEKLYKAKLLIIADGVDAKIGRQIGLYKTIDYNDLEICTLGIVENVEMENDRCHFYTGNKHFPGGYAWAFPKGNGQANVGLGVLAGKKGNKLANSLFESFVKEKFPNAKIVEKHLGSVPVGLYAQNLTADGVMVAGDAARQVNCLNGGGIGYALCAGLYAGLAGATALKKNDVRKETLKEYKIKWEKHLGKQQKRSYRVKENLLNLKDEELDKIANNIKYKADSLSLLSLFSRVFIHKPSLLWKIFKLLS